MRVRTVPRPPSHSTRGPGKRVARLSPRHGDASLDFLFVGHLPSDDLILMITTSCPQSPGRERGGFRHGDASLDLLAQSVPLRRPHDRHELSSFRRPSKKTVLFTCLTKGSSSSVAMNEVATLLPSSRSAPREKSAARTTPVSSIAGLSRNNMSLLL